VNGPNGVEEYAASSKLKRKVLLLLYLNVWHRRSFKKANTTQREECEQDLKKQA
jgi:hypothetical protein